jgi:GMC oxidoreductase/FAD binding domain
MSDTGDPARSIQKSRNHLVIIDLEQDNREKILSSHFDVCIVGAGAAGLALAVELLRHGKRIVIAESGGLRRWERQTQGLNKSEIAGLPYAGAHSGRFRALGGTTGTWAGQILELDDMDFVRRPWVPGSGWPIRKSDLKDAYARAIELEGLADSLLDDNAVWKALGRCGPPSLGEELNFAFSRYCPERKFTRLFGRIIKHNPDLVVCLHATACELFLDENGETVTSVRCRSLTGEEAFFVADRFVLCLGGIEVCRFLLQPHAAAPWHKHGLVGRFFQDHVHCFAADLLGAKLDDSWLFGPHRFVFDGYEYLPKIKLSPHAQRRYRVLNVSGMAEYDDAVYSAMRTTIVMVAGPASAVTKKELTYLLPRIPQVVWSYLRRRKDPRYVPRKAKLKLSVYCEQSPLSESRITLTEKRDRLQLFRSRIDWRVSPQEVATIRRYVQVVKRAFDERGLARIGPDPNFAEDSIVQQCRDTFHHMGGTRMGSSPTVGVVDANLRVFGTRNAYVCGSSVFPASGFANPTHTVLALAVRLAWHLKDLPAIGRTS